MNNIFHSNDWQVLFIALARHCMGLSAFQELTLESFFIILLNLQRDCIFLSVS